MQSGRTASTVRPSFISHLSSLIRPYGTAFGLGANVGVIPRLAMEKAN